MHENDEYLLKSYFCRMCDTTHKIKLDKKKCMKQLKFPFPYIFLHGESKNLLTTLYLDKDLQIRGVDVQELGDDDIFSKEQVISIINTLMKEIETLRRENRKMFEELEKIKKIRH